MDDDITLQLKFAYHSVEDVSQKILGYWSRVQNFIKFFFVCRYLSGKIFMKFQSVIVKSEVASRQTVRQTYAK